MRNPRDLWLWLTFGWPTLIQGYFLGCWGLILRIAENPRFEGVFLATDKRRWKRNADKPIKYTTALASWVNYGPLADEGTKFHEKEVHGIQYLTFNVTGGIISLLSLIGGVSWWDISWWASSGFLWMGVDYLISTIRYKSRDVSWEGVYFRTDPEQAAYAREEAEFDGRLHRWEKR